MNIKQLCVRISLLLACAAWQAQAGTVIQQVERAVGNPQARQTVTIYLDAGKMRVEGENPGQGKYLLIFDESKQVMWMADLGKNTYMEITKAQVEQMANQMGQMMAQMQQAMASVPPEQRAMVEQMMRGRMGGAAAPPQITVRDKGASGTVAQFTCKKWDVLTNGQVTQEVCAADPSQIKLDASAYETFKAVAEFYAPLRNMIPQGSGWSAPNAMEEIGGFPVQTVAYENGRPTSEWVLQSVEERTVDAGQFTLPPNLRKQEMPRMGR